MSGQVAQDRHGELVGAGDPEVQALQVFENLRRCLAQPDLYTITATGGGFAAINNDVLVLPADD